MKKIMLSALAVLFLIPALGAQTYDRAEVVKIMRGNVTLMNGVKADLEANKLSDAADKFYQFAKANSGLLKYTPPKGTKAEWDRINTSFVTNALEGAQASLVGDKTKAQAAFDRLMALNKEGHGAFR